MVVIGVSWAASGAVEKTNTLGLYPVSPTAMYFPSLLKATHDAAFMRSFADDDFPPGELAQSAPAEPCEEAPTPASREEAAPRLRESDAGVP